MCEVSTQHLPNIRITLFKRTRQSAWLDSVTTPADKKRVNSCVLETISFLGSSETKILSTKNKKCSLRRAANFTFFKFRGWRSKKALKKIDLRTV